jgi:hypothetical protein
MGLTIVGLAIRRCQPICPFNPMLPMAANAWVRMAARPRSTSASTFSVGLSRSALCQAETQSSLAQHFVNLIPRVR